MQVINYPVDCLDRVLLNDMDVTDSHSGEIHEQYGISHSAGALIIVCPDGLRQVYTQLLNWWLQEVQLESV